MNRSNVSADGTADTPASVPHGPGNECPCFPVPALDDEVADPTVRGLLSIVTSLALAIDSVLVEAIDCGDEQGNLRYAARMLVLQAGWIADLATLRCGGASYNGANPEEWMLPTSCQPQKAVVGNLGDAEESLASPSDTVSNLYPDNVRRGDL